MIHNHVHDDLGHHTHPLHPELFLNNLYNLCIVFVFSFIIILNLCEI